MLLYFYLILSAALLPILNNFIDIFRQSYSWWAVPLLFVGFFVVFIILHFVLLVLAFVPVSLKSNGEKGTKFYRFIVNIFAKPVCPILTAAESSILGTAANMFKIAGSVIVYGTTSAFIYSVIYWITMLL